MFGPVILSGTTTTTRTAPPATPDYDYDTSYYGPPTSPDYDYDSSYYGEDYDYGEDMWPWRKKKRA